MLKSIILTVFFSFCLIGMAQQLSLIYPKDNQVLSDEVKFVWNEKENSKGYEIQIGQDTNFSSFSNYSSIRSSLSLNLEGGSYFWRVISANQNLTTDTSDVNRFSIFKLSDQDSLWLWLRADSILKDSSDFVEQWYDLSDSNLLVRQSFNIRRPIWKDSTINNLPSIYFDSNNDEFLINKSFNYESFTLASVYKVNAQSNKFLKVMTGVNNWFMGPYFDKIQAFAGSFTPSIPLVFDKFYSQTVYVNRDTLSNYVNGINLGSIYSTTRPGAGWAVAKKLNGDVNEIIILRGFVKDSIVDMLNRYLMDKYAPPINLGIDITSCSLPDSIFVNIDYALNYRWNNGDTTSSIKIDSAGEYIITITDIFGRESADSIIVAIDTSSFQADFGFEDSTLCLGDSLVLNAGPDQYSYLWNTLYNTNSITIKTSGKYSVELENCKNQLSSDSVTITFNNPEFSLGLDTSVCFNQPFQLEADSTFMNVDFQWSTGESSTNIIADSSGVYSLLVTDSFGCRYSDSIIVELDSSLFGTTLGPDTSLCEGNFIGLINPDSSINSYLWGTGNTSTTQLVDTSGNYFVEVSNTKCSISDTIAISIKGFAPSAQFSLSNFCFQDSLEFMDSSTTRIGDTLTSWQWDFGDGFSSNRRNTAHVYSNVQSYKVVLEVTTDKNCSDTLSQFINIQPKPQANFGIIDARSCSKKVVSFVDSSNISSGTIHDYLWVFNDSLNANDSSSLREPTYTFDTLGVYNVSLIVQSNQGCLDTIVKPQFINPTPSVSFGYSGSCLNDSTFFTNQTILPQGNIESFLWATNGQLNLKEDPVFKYLSSGFKNVSLRVRTQAGCESTLVRQIEIFGSPVAEFIAPIACFGDSLQIEDASSSVDSITEYLYVFNGLDTSFLQDPSFVTSTIGSFPLALKVSSVNGCEDSIAKQIIVSPKPEAAFEILNNGSGIPFQIALNNNSKNAARYVWDFGNGDSSIFETPSYIYSDTGDFALKLKAYNGSNCLDSISEKVIVIPSYLDALLDKVILSENSNGELIVSARIINTGSNTIESIKLSANLNNQYQINETFERTIFRGNSSTYTFASTFKKGVEEKPDFVCLKIEEVNNIEDELQSNNQLCEKGFNEKIVLNVYPNPASESVTLEYVLPLDGELKIRVFDQLGRMVLDEFKCKIESGFHQTNLNVINLQAGLYYYSFSINGEEINGSFVKR